MKVNDITPIIQGEGKYAGYPMLMIRLSGCNLQCTWCDTTHHKIFKEMSTNDVAHEIRKSKQHYVLWSGGEPTLQIKEIEEVISKTRNNCHMLETNGTKPIPSYLFKYISLSPKKKGWSIPDYKCEMYDIKVVTDLDTVGVDLIDDATILMPLTTGDKKKDLEIKQKVWDYCIATGIRYSPRLQIDLMRK